LQLLRELLEVCRDKVIVDLAETLEPECRNLAEYGTLLRDRIWQDHVKGRDAIRGDKEQRLPEIKDFAHLSAAQFFYPGQIDEGLCSD